MARPKVALLDRRRIALAAVSLVDRHGDFTIAELGKQLGVNPASLYHHVSGRDDVVDLMREEISRRIDITGFDTEDWLVAIELFARSYRAAFSRHPGCIRLMATSPVRDEHSLTGYDTVCAALIDAKFPLHLVMGVIQSLDSFLLGAALDLAASENMYLADPEAHPHLSAALAAVPSSARAETAFETGLQVMLAGLRHGGILPTEMAESESTLLVRTRADNGPAG